VNKNCISFISCPLTKTPLKLEIHESDGNRVVSGVLINEDKNLRFLIKDGIANLLYPPISNGSDKIFQNIYEANSTNYDEGMNWLFNCFFEKEEKVRSKLIGLLNLEPNDFVLNLGCGTGSDSLFIIKKLSKSGKLFNLDITSGLLKIAREKIAPLFSNSEFFIGNGSALPFPDGTFDKTFHFGGINEFSQKRKAIEEMVRVTKKGGRVVFGDESVAPWLSRKEFGKIVKTANPLYKHKPPLDILPDNVQDVSLHYLLGNSFYVISFLVATPTELNLDLVIPGKRGGTLRTRYADSKMIKNGK